METSSHHRRNVRLARQGRDDRRPRRDPLHVSGDVGPSAEIDRKLWHPRQHCEQIGVGDREAAAHQIGMLCQCRLDQIETLEQPRPEDFARRLGPVGVEQRTRTRVDFAGDEVEPFLKPGAHQRAVG